MLPQLDLVVAHKVDMQQQPAAPGAPKRPRAVTGSEYDAILSMLVASHCGANCP